MGINARRIAATLPVPILRATRFLGARLPVIGILMGLAAFTLIAAEAYISINGLEQRTQWVGHTYEVLESLESSFSVAKDAQTSTRNYAVSGASGDLAEFNMRARQLWRSVRQLRDLTADDSVQAESVSLLANYVQEYLAALQEVNRFRSENSDAVQSIDLAAGNRVRESMERVRTQITAMQAFEGKLLHERSGAVERITRHTKRWIVFGTAGVYLVILAAVFFLSREMRERERAESALRRANDSLTRRAGQLETANKELDSFSYSISHDLRIPLRAVTGYARMIEEDYADKVGDEGRRFLKVIRDNSKRMSDLIDDLLNFSRLGRKEIAAAQVDMNELVAAVVNDMQGRESYPSARIAIEPLPAAWGDRTLLYQVWVNLISNALKYSAKTEHPVVRISGTVDKSEAVYSVSDNGVGFDMQYYDKLFGVFQRLHSNDEFSGTGVGLAIVQRIVNRHGGRVWAEGKPNEGAEFFFSIPLAEGGNG